MLMLHNNFKMYFLQDNDDFEVVSLHPDRPSLDVIIILFSYYYLFINNVVLFINIAFEALLRIFVYAFKGTWTAFTRL